jgi:hypothetical protein
MLTNAAMLTCASIYRVDAQPLQTLRLIRTSKQGKELGEIENRHLIQ